MKGRIWLAVISLCLIAFLRVLGQPLSMDLSFSLAVNPMASVCNPSHRLSLSGQLTLSYTLSAWDLTSISEFDRYGLAEQELRMTGFLGAFDFDATMDFDARVPTLSVYSYPASAIQIESVTTVNSAGSATRWSQSIWGCATPTIKITPVSAFSTLEAYTHTFLYGLNLDLLLYIKGDEGPKTVTGNSWYGTPYPFACGGPSAQTFHLEQLGSYNVGACVPRCGSGWKMSCSGMIGGALFCANAYFNLEEHSLDEVLLKQHAAVDLADSLLLGGSYYLPWTTGETCSGAFNRSYITLNGVTLGCANLDIGLNMTCEGFEWFKILASDVRAVPFIDLDLLWEFAITETGSIKTVTVEPEISIDQLDCFSFRLHLGHSLDQGGLAIGGIELKGWSISINSDALSFLAITSLDPRYESLGGVYVASDVSSPKQHGFFIPDKNYSKETFITGVEPGASIDDAGEGYYRLVCLSEEYYDIYEALKLAGSSDACCGGSLRWALDAFFGHRKVLIADSFWFWYKDEDGYSFKYNTPPTASEPAVLGSSPPYCEDDNVTYGALYCAAPGDTLLGWVRTAASLNVPLGANCSLGTGVSFTKYGWESVSITANVSW